MRLSDDIIMLYIAIGYGLHGSVTANDSMHVHSYMYDIMYINNRAAVDFQHALGSCIFV